MGCSRSQNYPQPLDTNRVRITSFHICSVNRITNPWSPADYLRKVTSSNSTSKPNNSSILITDRMRLMYALLFTSVFLVSIWAVFAFNDLYEMGWRQFGLRPRNTEGLIGILTYPFLHRDWGHLWNNTMSFFTLNTFLFFFYRSIALRVWLWLFFMSGTLLWVIAGGGNHIGASGIIYGLAAFLFMSGVIRKNTLLLRVSLVVAFLYGGIIWWMLPMDNHVSWEGHLSGAIVGTLLAIAFRQQGPQDPVYQFEKDPPNAPLPEWWMAAHPDHPDTIAQKQAELNAQTPEANIQNSNNAHRTNQTATAAPAFTHPTSSAATHD